MKQPFILILFFSFISLNAKTKENFIKTDTTIVKDKTIEYKVYQDNNYLYLNISTLDVKTAHSITRGGLTVYFDVKAKEKENVYLKYPSNIEPPERGQRTKKNNRDDDDTSMLELAPIIEKLPSEAEYGFYNDKVEFHKDLNSEDISIAINIIGEELNYNLKIPKNKILKKNKTDLTELSIGIKTNEPERQNHERPNDSMRQSNGNRPSGGRGGGMSGGRGGGNREGQSGGNNRPERPTQDRADKADIDFWFDAQLDAE